MKSIWFTVVLFIGLLILCAYSVRLIAFSFFSYNFNHFMSYAIAFCIIQIVQNIFRDDDMKSEPGWVNLFKVYGPSHSIPMIVILALIVGVIKYFF